MKLKTADMLVAAQDVYRCESRESLELPSVTPISQLIILHINLVTKDWPELLISLLNQVSLWVVRFRADCPGIYRVYNHQQGSLTSTATNMR